MKLICAGLLKTGTKSIARALRILGYKVYDFDEQILYYMDEWLDLYKHGKKPDFYTMFKDVDVVIDGPCNFFFEELIEAFPDAKVILSIREEDAWIRSYTKHDKTTKNSLLVKIKCLLPTLKNVWFLFVNGRIASVGSPGPKSSYICRKRYRWHNDRVKSVVPADKLLVYNVEQGWKPLCEFTNKNIPDQLFPHLNVKGEYFGTFLKETQLGKKIVREYRVLQVCCVAVVVALIGITYAILI